MPEEHPPIPSFWDKVRRKIFPYLIMATVASFATWGIWALSTFAIEQVGRLATTAMESLPKRAPATPTPTQTKRGQQDSLGETTVVAEAEFGEVICGPANGSMVWSAENRKERYVALLDGVREFVFPDVMSQVEEGEMLVLPNFHCVQFRSLEQGPVKIRVERSRSRLKL